MRTAKRKIISDLADFHYLTVSQLTTLEYKDTSRSYVHKEVNELVAAGLVLALPRQVVTHMQRCWEKRHINASERGKSRSGERTYTLRLSLASGSTGY